LELDDVGHACLLYENHNQQKAVVLPFVRDGLRNEEFCLFVTSNQSIYDWLLEFQAYGIDVKREVEKGALAVAAGEDWRRSPGFNSLAKARELWSAIEPKLLQFPGVRIIGDAAWTLIEPPVVHGELCHWEATADLLYQGEAVRTICMYDLNLHSPSAVRAALRTHPTALVSGRQYANPHYEAPRILENEPHLNDSVADRAFILEMLGQLESVHAC
jgi:hypothetical protein